MAWLIPFVLFVAGFTFWRLSFRATDFVIAACRWVFALILMILALVYVLAISIS